MSRWIPRAVARAGAVALVLASTRADAIEIARVTRHGYVLVDEAGAANPYHGVVPTTDDRALLQLLAETTDAIERAHAPHVDYVAFLQATRDRGTISFFVAIANDTTGLAIPSPTGGARETFDLNGAVGTAFPVRGLVFLNDVGLYRSTATASFARRFLCPQEFAHATSAYIRIPPYPGAGSDAGAPDASTAADASADDDASIADASAPPPPPPPIPANALRGRLDEHWSFFLNTGGSPMEGNNWIEDAPGVFHTGPLAARFSPLDLYLMGLIPPSEVPPFWLIAEPDVAGQTDDNGQIITRQSDPLLSDRVVTVRGRRVTYTIDDVIRANGPRRAPGSDGGLAPSPDLRVAWVLLATEDSATDALVSQFDGAIEACMAGYAGATGERAHLLALTPADSDGDDADATGDATPDDAPAPVDDAASRADAAADAAPTAPHGAGCGCDATPARRTPASASALMAAVIAAGAWRRRSRRGRRRRSAWRLKSDQFRGRAGAGRARRAGSVRPLAGSPS